MPIVAAIFSKMGSHKGQMPGQPGQQPQQPQQPLQQGNGAMQGLMSTTKNFMGG